MVVDDDNNNDDNDEDDGDLEGINVLFHHIKDPTNAYHRTINFNSANIYK